MIRTCLVCTSPMPPNDTLERLPVGERFAFDPVQGRLWVVCRRCRRWNLAPIEERWEALDDLERLTRDRARLLGQTDNISLYSAGDVEIIRVGRAERVEEAWWRYGREFLRRREQYRKIAFVGTVTVGAIAVGGLTSGAFSTLAAWLIWRKGRRILPRRAPDAVRWLRFGSDAWRGSAHCPACGYELRRVAFAERERLRLILSPESQTVGLAHACPRCGSEDAPIRLEAGVGERAARRILAYHHFAGASEERVRSAAERIERAGSPVAFARRTLGDGRTLGGLDDSGTVAMEIVTNEAAEQRLLRAELAELQLVWREEERVAAIADGELTPAALLESLRLKITGQNARPRIAGD